MRNSTVVVKVPDGMLSAAIDRLMGRWEDSNDAYRNSSMGVEAEKQLRKNIPLALEAALLWLSEHPQVPTDEQARELIDSMPALTITSAKIILEAWQRRCFVQEEPEIPAEIKDLLWEQEGIRNFKEEPDHNKAVVEAFRRGRQAR